MSMWMVQVAMPILGVRCEFSMGTELANLMDEFMGDYLTGGTKAFRLVSFVVDRSTGESE